MELKNSVVVITGGAQGLGYAMAERLGAKGARLALIDINGEQLSDAARRLEQQDIEVRGYTVDISNESQVEETFAAIGRDFGTIHVLVNNAGLLRDALFVKAKDGKVLKKMSADDFRKVIDVNLTGSFLCGREASVQMIETGTQGVIINISSISRAGNIGQANYSASKAGVVAMTTTWAKGMARYGIRAAAIAPGFIATDMTASMRPDMLKKLEAMVPVGRLGTADEVAHTVEYIVTNDYLNGRVIELDGGMRL